MMKALLLLLASAPVVAINQIVGYQPRSNVVDYLIMDQDKKVMDSRLSIGEIVYARRMYEWGGHSMAIANITLLNLNSAQSYQKGTAVTGMRKKGEDGEDMKLVGTLLDDVSWSANTGNITVHVLYETGDTPASIRECKVGALYLTSQASLDGCFNDTGTVSFSDGGDAANRGDEYQYAYNIRFDNWNRRTFQSFSTEAKNTMKACSTCPYYEDFQTYVDYYGTSEYAEMFVMSASKNESTFFPGARGNADFSTFNSGNKIAHAEAMQKGTLFLNVWMEVVRHLNDAMVKCEANQEDAAVQSLDSGIALYAGSEAGEEKSTPEGGQMLYNMANRRAHNTRTAGSAAERPVGTAYVNHQIEKEFKKAQLAISTGSCDSALHSKRRIVALMKVPLLQGLLRYAHILAFEKSSVTEEAEKEQGETSAFLAASIPHLYKCDKNGADAVYNMMRVGPTQNIDFPKIKAILERNYDCMGVSCPLIGGKYDANTGTYVSGTEPCTSGTLDGPDLDLRAEQQARSRMSSNGNAGAAVGYVFAACIGVLVAFVVYRKYQRGPSKFGKSSLHGPPPNLAAISEIA